MRGVFESAILPDRFDGLANPRTMRFCPAGRYPLARCGVFKKYGLFAGIALVLVVVAIFVFSSKDNVEQEEPEVASEPTADPEMVENVAELEAEIRRVEEEEGEAAACAAVEEAEELIFMATEVAWLHRNPGTELRPVYKKAVADGVPMTDVFDFEAGEGSTPVRYEEWDEYDLKMAELKKEMATTVSGKHRARSLEAICEISETNPHGFTLVSDTLDGLSGEMSCGDSVR
jgi:hypothetical protein